MGTFVVYLVKYSGNKLPKYYIGSTSKDKIDSGYLGSIRSKKWKSIFNDEVKNNRYLFKIEVLSIHKTREDALLSEYNIRVELDENNEKIGAKIRNAEMQKIPYMLIFGDKEISEDSVNVRKQGKGDMGSSAITQFISQLDREIHEKSLP